MNIGNCHEHLDQLASAWGSFRNAEAMARAAGDAALQAEAARRADALTPKLAKLAIVVPPGSRVAGFVVTKDGAPVGEAQYGVALPDARTLANVSNVALAIGGAAVVTGVVLVVVGRSDAGPTTKMGAALWVRVNAGVSIEGAW